MLKPLLLAGATAALVGGLASLSSPVPAGAIAPALAVKAAPAFKPTRFSVEVRGSGPDVILLPGLASSRDVWDGTVAAVPGYRYHLVQVAGFAGAPVRGNAQGRVVSGVADELARYIAARRLKRPALIGHSMGGTVALMAASRHPAQVGRVMVVDMTPQPAGFVGSTASGVRGLANALQGLTATPDGRRMVESVMEMFGGPQPADRRSDADVVARATHELAVTDLSGELSRIRAPLTVIYAIPNPDQRAYVQGNYEAAYRAKRDAKLVRVDGSGHMIMFDQPTKFRAAVKAFLSSSLPT
ncbi:MAG TPA: alpha/beta hydrolase [Allosphingosinicella sp.]|jgi:pimeloyl-ACP methyl ester carboxylesterase|uniref:alpha/beta fold hydrolase n=1 Tax=Allosphingosinicella sp. TaxID=2823234 RepID=UPI002F29DD51